MPRRRDRSLVLRIAGGVVLLALAGCTDNQAIRVGVLHSVSGVNAASERALLDATLFALEELRESGLDGRTVAPIVADCASNPSVCRTEAARLIEQEGVAAVFGGWDSPSRRAIRPIVERSGSLLVYPRSYEGLETSPNIIYMGATPNQVILPALRWLAVTKGKRIAMVGTDDIYGRAVAEIVRDRLQSWGGELVVEAFVPQGMQSVDGLIEAIEETEPDAIISSLEARMIPPFFSALTELESRGEGPRDDDPRYPALLLNITESELAGFGLEDLVGHHVVGTYFQSHASEQTRAIVERFRQRFGQSRPFDEAMVSAIMGVSLWAAAVEEAGSSDPARVREAMVNRSLEGPAGMVHVDSDTGHSWHQYHIGRIEEGGRVSVVVSARAPIEPQPFPESRSQEAWTSAIAELSANWGGGWRAPGGAD